MQQGDHEYYNYDRLVNRCCASNILMYSTSMAELVGDKTDGMGYDTNTAFPLLGIIIVLL